MFSRLTLALILICVTVLCGGSNARTRSDSFVYVELEEALPEGASCLIRHMKMTFDRNDIKSVEPPAEARTWFEQKLHEKLNEKLHLDARLMSNSTDTSTAFDITVDLVKYLTRRESKLRGRSGGSQGPLDFDFAIMTHAEVEVSFNNSDAHYLMFAAYFEATGDSYEKVFGKIIDELVKALKVE